MYDEYANVEVPAVIVLMLVSDLTSELAYSKSALLFAGLAKVELSNEIKAFVP